MVVVVRRGVQRNPERLQREMEEVFRALLPQRSGVHIQSQGAWRPPLEVYETEKSLVIIAEIAGVDEDRMSIIADSGLVTIRGERLERRPGEARRYRETGIAYGEFIADVYLPFAVNLDKTEANYQQGILRIDLPRVAARTIMPRLSDESQVRQEKQSDG
ncbi:Hsp20/alpha crystallin family protein [soil metagenome]